jgi:hypothetical protein
MNTKSSLFAVLAACFACVILLSACKDPPPPEKSTLDKLDSQDVSEQEEGLDEAEDKYGVKK